MDATLHTNDMKFYLFTLMMFDVHHIGVGSLDYDKSTNMWQHIGVVDSPKDKTFTKHV